MPMKQSSLILLALAAAAVPVRAQTSYVDSPDGRTRLTLTAGAQLTYSVTHAGATIVSPSAISLTLGDGRVLGRDARVRRTGRRTADDLIQAVVPEKNAQVRDRYNELRVELRGGYAVIARAYDDAVAWRFVTDLPDSLVIAAEEATFRFGAPHRLLFGDDTSFFSHQEPAYRWLPMDSLAAGRKALLPILVDIAGGPKVVITESALEDYAGMHIAGTGGPALVAAFPPYALADSARSDRNVPVTRPAPYIARVAGRRAFPWRIVAIADRDGQLLENQIVYRLAPELRLADVSWIRPGKVAWDWWNALNLHGVSFRAGINTATYRHYIDFAARYGIPYIILDEGWSPTTDLLRVVPALDLPELVRYGQQKGVGIILWALWRPLDLGMEEILDTWQQWGVRGIKVDFMQRDDQAMVRFYWRLAAEAAQRQLLVDYHGAYKPSGLRRAFPNVLTREGVRGLEHNKWSADVTPEHDLSLPFTRMFAGPMDYTPGAMRNAARAEHQAIFSRPMSMGTRAHELAKYVVFESPLQMLADNPAHYEAEPDAMTFLAAVPTTWDETRALAAQVGDFVLLARRKGSEWWVGAMTDGTARGLDLDLSFLGPGAWKLDLVRDGVNADRYGEDYVRESAIVTGADHRQLQLAPGGGWIARISR
ncbi:MAG: glycoside hydrolase family 97 protein [Gemmatimonadetes bacterium]|nr:glycoside hydrolase family 97 protein [Gemmatimonadota bacterium]